MSTVLTTIANKITRNEIKVKIINHKKEELILDLYDDELLYKHKYNVKQGFYNTLIILKKRYKNKIKDFVEGNAFATLITGTLTFENIQLDLNNKSPYIIFNGIQVKHPNQQPE